MYKTKLQELCQSRSWKLPKYDTSKHGLDHMPLFKSVVVVNGQNFETPAPCKSSKDAQNAAAQAAVEYFSVNRPIPQSAAPAYTQPPVLPIPQTRIATISGQPGILIPGLPVAPLPSSLPVAPAGLLMTKNSSIMDSLFKETTQQKSDEEPGTVIVHRDPLNSNDIQHVYKNRLQQYAQKKKLGLPVYTSESEGPPHICKFKSKVSFDGKSYEMPNFFSTLRTAENAAAKVACQMLSIDGAGKDWCIYKNLLKELIIKRSLGSPSYETVRSGLPHRPVFSSVVRVGGNTFHGIEANNKKQAEINAAKVAYLALMESVGTPNVPASLGCNVENDLINDFLPAKTRKNDDRDAGDFNKACTSAKRSKSSGEKETATFLAASASGSGGNQGFPHQSNSPIHEPTSFDNDKSVVSKTALIQRPASSRKARRRQKRKAREMKRLGEQIIEGHRS